MEQRRLHLVGLFGRREGPKPGHHDLERMGLASDLRRGLGHPVSRIRHHTLGDVTQFQVGLLRDRSEALERTVFVQAFTGHDDALRLADHVAGLDRAQELFLGSARRQRGSCLDRQERDDAVSLRVEGVRTPGGDLERTDDASVGDQTGRDQTAHVRPGDGLRGEAGPPHLDPKIADGEQVAIAHVETRPLTHLVLDLPEDPWNGVGPQRYVDLDVAREAQANVIGGRDGQLGEFDDPAQHLGNGIRSSLCG